MAGKRLTRRKFIQKTTTGTIGIGLLGNEIISLTDHTTTLPGIKDYRRLGRTNAMVSDIGSGIPYSEAVLKAVIDSGVNFIETAESYDNGRNERMIGNVIKNLEREKLFLTTKINTTLGLAESSDDIVRRAEESLRRLNTPYVDLYMMHQVQSIIKVTDRNFHKACDRLEKEGKIRFRGLSCHGSFWWQEQGGSLEDILMAAIEDGRYDVLFFPYNFLDPGMGERILAACKSANIGTMIMKSNPISVFEGYENIINRGEELGYLEKKDYETKKVQMEKARSFFLKYNMISMDDLKKGAYRYILSNENVGTICCRFRNFSDIDFFMALSGSRLDEPAANLLSDFRECLGFLNCRIGCSICERNCPHHLPVNMIMRFYYYAQALNEYDLASENYHLLAKNGAGICQGCECACTIACPNGVAIKDLLLHAHNALT